MKGLLCAWRGTFSIPKEEPAQFSRTSGLMPGLAAGSSLSACLGKPPGRVGFPWEGGQWFARAASLGGSGSHSSPALSSSSSEAPTPSKMDT